MRSIKLLLIVVGVSALALAFVGHVAADGPSFNASDFGRTVNGTRFAFRMVPVKSFSSDNATSSGLAGAPRQDILRVGVLTAKADADSCTTTGTPPVTTCTPPPTGHSRGERLRPLTRTVESQESSFSTGPDSTQSTRMAQACSLSMIRH